jgi:hypothetical protein
MSGDNLSQDAWQIGISAIPRTIVDGQSVRFIPKIMKEELFDDAFTESGGWINLTINHFLYVGQSNRIVEFFSTDTLPAPLVEKIPYWIVQSSGDDSSGIFKVSDTPSGSPITLTDAGTGTHTMRRYRVRALCGNGASPAFYWTFGNGATSDWAMPVIEFNEGVTEKTQYDAQLNVVDSNGATLTATHPSFITVDTDENMPELPEPHLFKICLVIRSVYYSPQYHEPSYYAFAITREGNEMCDLMLSDVVATDTMDMIGTMKFKITQGASSDTYDGVNWMPYIQEGAFVDLFMGTEHVFSGLIRRVTKNVQNGFDTSLRVNIFDVECDSSLAFFKQFPVDAWAMTGSGEYVSDSPGCIMRRIMTPDSTGERRIVVGDFRGIIDCLGPDTAYKINSISPSEQAGSQYQHIMNLYQLTNYDLRVRTKYTIQRYHHLVPTHIEES